MAYRAPLEPITLPEEALVAQAASLTDMTARPRHRSRVTCPTVPPTAAPRPAGDIVTPSILVANPWTRLPTNPWISLPAPEQHTTRFTWSRLQFVTGRASRRDATGDQPPSRLHVSRATNSRTGPNRLGAALRLPWSEDQAITILVVAGLLVLLICGIVGISALIDLA